MENNYTRTTEREKTMQALYQMFAMLENDQDADATVCICNQYGVEDFKEVPVFSRVVFALSLEHMDEIKTLIQQYLINWTFQRLDNVAKAILVEAVSEGNYGRLSPRNVIISEAVNLAKNYLSVGQHRFINAVLDKALEHYEFK